MSTRHTLRRATTYLEIQVAMVLLSISMGGLYSLSVVQTKQNSRLANVLPAAQTPALNAAANEWERKLGVYANVETAVVPAPTPTPYVYFEAVADNQDTGPITFYHKSSSDTYGWIAWNYWDAYRGNAHYHPSDGLTGSYANIRIFGIPSGEYEVFTTYPASNSLGDSIEHRIFDGAVQRASAFINQKVDPNDITYDGDQWECLGIVEVNSGQLTVRFYDGSGGENFVLADAIMIRSVRSFNLVSVDETVAGGAVAVVETP